MEKDKTKKIKKKYNNLRRNMKKKKLDYLCYEARCWCVETIDLADFKM